MSSRRTVHIPIVQPGGAGAGEDRLLEVYTQLGGLEPLTRYEEEERSRSDQKSRDKDWDAVAAPLRKIGLYQAGCAAASAVRKLGIKRPPTALYQQVSRLAWIDRQRLHPAMAQAPTEGRSAELGLALALLMCACGSRTRQVIATGALGGQPAGVVRDDVEVLPVASVAEKLRLVLTLARHGALPGLEEQGEMLFFVPRRFEQDGAWIEVDGLPETGELGRLGVKVVPVARLGEAADVLEAHCARHLAADRIAASVIVVLVLLAGLGMAWSAVRETHVAMAFLPAGGQASEAEPFQACFAPDGGYYPIALGQNGIGHDIPGGATLGWRVRIGEPLEARRGLERWFAPEAYHVAQVMVSEHSPAKVMVPELPDSGMLSVPPGGVWEWAWKLNDEAESNGLVLLARPERPFDPNALRADLIEQFPAAAADHAGEAVDVSAAVNFVAAKAPGAAKFIVETVEDRDRCSP